MPYTLNTRQTLVYLSTCDIWRAALTSTGTPGEVGDALYTRVAQGIPCFYRYTQNDSDPNGLGRLKRRSALTEDRLKVPYGVDIQDGDYVLDTTPGDDNAGTIHRVEGQPKIRPDRGARQLNEIVCQIMSEDKSPAEIVP